MRIVKLSFVVLILLLSGSFAFAGIWTENFDADEPEGWTVVKGDWEVKKGEYVEPTGIMYGRTLFGDLAWTDYTVEVDVTLVQAVGANTCAGLLMRVDEEGLNGYRFWIRVDSGKAQLSKWVNENTYTQFVEPVIGIKAGQKYRLKVVVEGQTFQCFVDDENIGDYEDKENFSASGKVGLLTHTASSAFDNFVISGPGITNLAVEQGSKLATCWGGLKSLN